LSHDWLLKFVQHRVADRRILRRIQKWLKAGGREEGEWKDTEVGSPQGSVISPLLANIYLHYVFELWVDAWRRKCAQGDVMVVRYADDNVLGFQYRAEADRFLEELRDRLRKFGLELHADKTRRSLQLAGTVPRQGESRECYARGDNHPLDAVEHIGDRRDAPNRSTGLEAPQFLAAGRIECIKVAVVITAEN